MKDILLGILATVAVILGTLLFIYGASAMPFEEVGLFRELSLTLGLGILGGLFICLLYTSPSPRDATLSRMPSSA